MKICFCDRCGEKAHEGILISDYEKFPIIFELYGMNKEKIDLCNDCMESLREWFKRRNGKCE